MKRISIILLVIMACLAIVAGAFMYAGNNTLAICVFAAMDALAVVLVLTDPPSHEHYVHNMYMFPFIV